jgi:Cu(I)/Ag(I) efflux system membrane protein CusA/SilA
MFNPLAYTKSFALGGVALLAITLVPRLLPTLLRGRLRSQQQVWIVRSFVNIYKPMLEFSIRCPDVIVVITGTFLLVGLPVFPRKVPWIFFTVGAPFNHRPHHAARRALQNGLLCILLVGGRRELPAHPPAGEEFMPALDELSLLDMPITRPNVNLTQATDDLKERDAVLRGFPEVRQVVGKIGRADTPTDPAPIDMVETVISFLPKELWPHRGVALEAVQSEARAVLSDLTQRGVAKSVPADDGGSVAEAVAMASLVQFDRILRGICVERQQENVEPRTRELAIEMRRQLLPLVTSSGAEKAALPESAWDAQDRKIAQMYGARFNEEILLEDVTSAVEGNAGLPAKERSARRGR